MSLAIIGLRSTYVLFRREQSHVFLSVAYRRSARKQTKIVVINVDQDLPFLHVAKTLMRFILDHNASLQAVLLNSPVSCKRVSAILLCIFPTLRSYRNLASSASSQLRIRASLALELKVCASLRCLAYAPGHLDATACLAFIVPDAAPGRSQQKSLYQAIRVLCFISTTPKYCYTRSPAETQSVQSVLLLR